MCTILIGINHTEKLKHHFRLKEALFDINSNDSANPIDDIVILNDMLLNSRQLIKKPNIFRIDIDDNYELFSNFSHFREWFRTTYDPSESLYLTLIASKHTILDMEANSSNLTKQKISNKFISPTYKEINYLTAYTIQVHRKIDEFEVNKISLLDHINSIL